MHHAPKINAPATWLRNSNSRIPDKKCPKNQPVTVDQFLTWCTLCSSPLPSATPKSGVQTNFQTIGVKLVVQLQKFPGKLEILFLKFVLKDEFQKSIPFWHQTVRWPVWTVARRTGHSEHRNQNFWIKSQSRPLFAKSISRKNSLSLAVLLVLTRDDKRPALRMNTVNRPSIDYSFRLFVSTIGNVHF